MARIGLIIVGVAALGCAVAPSVSSVAQTVPQSFDCRRAVTASEHAVCENDRLAEMDQAAGIAFNQIPATFRKEARAAQLQAIQARDACGSDRACILDQQISALQSYDGFGPAVPVPPWVGSYRLSLLAERQQPFATRLPTEIGQCARSKIATITDRFGAEMKPPASPDDVDTGTAVGFANSGGQVSYSYQSAVASSAIGDEVLLCLVSVPKDCPKGDNRGRFYSATNLRTKGSWLLPDSAHMCGGA